MKIWDYFRKRKADQRWEEQLRRYTLIEAMLRETGILQQQDGKQPHRYTPKPPAIEAMRFMGDNAVEIVKWAEGCIDVSVENEGDHYFQAIILGDGEHARKGDYIVRDTNGTYVAMKPDEFARAYEAEKRPRLMYADKLEGEWMGWAHR